MILLVFSLELLFSLESFFLSLNVLVLMLLLHLGVKTSTSHVVMSEAVVGDTISDKWLVETDRCDDMARLANGKGFVGMDYIGHESL